MHFDWFDSAHHKSAQVRLNRTQFKQRGHSLIFLLIGILFLVIVAGGAYYLGKLNTPQPKACTLEAKICADGSSVGRVGPNCEFAPCPSPSSTNSAVSPAPNGAGETANWKTYTNTQYGFSLQYQFTWAVSENIYTPNLAPMLFIVAWVKNAAMTEFPSDMSVTVYSNSNNEDVKTFINKHIALIPGDTNIQQITVSGEQGIRVSLPGATNNENVIISHRGWIYQIRVSHSERVQDDIPSQIFDQILSTFKFIP